MFGAGKQSDNNRRYDKGKGLSGGGMNAPQRQPSNQHPTDQSKTGSGREYPGVYVRRLPHTMTVAGLDAIFKRYGTIMNTRIFSSGSQRCNGCATVTFASAEAATNAIEGTNGMWVDQSHKLIVEQDFHSILPANRGNIPSVAPPGLSLPGPTTAIQPNVSTSSAAAMPTHSNSANRTVFAGGLPPWATEMMIQEVFGSYGKIVSSTLLGGHSDSTSYAKVEFSKAEGAAQAMSKGNGRVLADNYQLAVAYSLASLQQPRATNEAYLGSSGSSTGISTVPEPRPYPHDARLHTSGGIPQAPPRRRPGAPVPQSVIIGTPQDDPSATNDSQRYIHISQIDYSQVSFEDVQANIDYYNLPESELSFAQKTVFVDDWAIVILGSNGAAKRQLMRMRDEDFGTGTAVQMQLF